MSAPVICELIRTCGFTYRDEDQLQEGIAGRLTEAGLAVEREVRISARDRLDLLVDGVCVEVKVAGPADRLLTQLRRYAASERVTALVVATTRSRHRALPPTIGGKPLSVVHLGGAG